MSNHRSVHLNFLVFCLYLCLCLFPFFLLLCFHQACLVLLGSVLVRTNGGKKKPSKTRISLLCWQHEKNLFLNTCTLPYLTQTIYQNSETHERAGHE